TNVLWPDFSPKELDKAILDYSKRGRRFGGV
ncbi:MAG TPA: isoprenyl transferase, partial [Clostridiales bacterium]|nr:isoprenyl transferase [Clostridiales bacterium]